MNQQEIDAVAAALAEAANKIGEATGETYVSVSLDVQRSKYSDETTSKVEFRVYGTNMGSLESAATPEGFAALIADACQKPSKALLAQIETKRHELQELEKKAGLIPSLTVEELKESYRGPEQLPS